MSLFDEKYHLGNYGQAIFICQDVLANTSSPEGREVLKKAISIMEEEANRDAGFLRLCREEDTEKTDGEFLN